MYIDCDHISSTVGNLDGLDALVFTGGVENQPVRGNSLAKNLGFLVLKLDPSKNNSAITESRYVSLRRIQDFSYPSRRLKRRCLSQCWI